MSQITPAQIKELREKTGAGFGDCKNALTEAQGNIEEAVKVLRKKGLAAAGKKAGRITSEGLVHVDVINGTGVMVEVNCETDFVAQNPDFRALVSGIAGLVASTDVDTVEAISELAWPNDEENRTVAQVISVNIAKIGENLSLRRFVRFAPSADSLFGTYVHGNGRIGVLVEVKSDKSEAKAAGEALAKDIAMHIAAAEPRYLHRDQVTEQDLATEREVARDQAVKSGKPENIVEKMVSGKMEKFYGEAVLLEQPYIRDDKQTITQVLASRGKENGGAKFDLARFERYKVGEGIQKKEDDFVAEVMAQAGM